MLAGWFLVLQWAHLSESVLWQCKALNFRDIAFEGALKEVVYLSVCKGQISATSRLLTPHFLRNSLSVLYARTFGACHSKSLFLSTSLDFHPWLRGPVLSDLDASRSCSVTFDNDFYSDVPPVGEKSSCYFLLRLTGCVQILVPQLRCNHPPAIFMRISGPCWYKITPLRE